MEKVRFGALRGAGFRPGWLAIGVAVGVILAPAAAVAAGIGVTSLVGPNGTKATVARSGQLLTAQADPNMIRDFVADTDGDGSSSGCDKAYGPPKGYSFVLTQISVDTWTNTTPGADNDTLILLGTAKSNCLDPIGDVNSPGIGELTIPFSPGIVVPAGDDVGIVTNGNVNAEAYGEGYLVPSAAAPHPTQLPVHGATWTSQGSR